MLRIIEYILQFVVIVMLIAIIYVTLAVKATELEINKIQGISRQDIRLMYDRLWAATGEQDKKVPISVIESPVVNAYATSTEIVVYTGLLKTLRNTDELALVLAHEISHKVLGHVEPTLDFPINEVYYIQTKEAEADKYGAVLALRAGYNVCTGREFWKRFAHTLGEYLDSDHPTSAYRYDQLNINCERY